MFTNYKILNVTVNPIPESDKLAFPVMAKPKLLGCYSVSPEGHFELGKERMRVIVEPRLPLSLIKWKNVRVRPEPKSIDDYLDHLLYFIESEKHSILKPWNSGAVFRVDAEIVCTRDVLQLLMCTPYESGHGWTIAVTKYRNTMYMCQLGKEDSHTNEDKINKILAASRLQELQQHCSMGSGVTAQNGSQQSEQNGQFYSVFATDINGMRVIFDAPVVAEGNKNPSIYVLETFTALKLRLAHMNRSEWYEHNRSESIKWWTECFLVGIENILIGLCDNEYNVHNLHRATARDIYKQCEEVWSACACANFMVRVLGAIKNAMATVNSPSSVYLFELSNGKITYTISEGRNRNTFIPDWFRLLLDNK